MAKKSAKPAQRPRITEELRLAHKSRLAIIDGIYKLLRAGVGGATLVLCFYFVSDAFKQMAGKSTDLSAALKAVVDLRVNEYVSYGLAGMFGVGWYTERRLRRRTIKGQGKHIKELEQRLDPERRSSGLLPDGQPKKGDKDA